MRKDFRHLFCLSHIEKTNSFIENILNYISIGICLFLMLLTTSEVIGRYAFNHPIPGHHEIVELLIPALAFLAIAYLQRLGGHIRIDIVVYKFKGRQRYLLECLFSLLGLLILVFMAIGTLENTTNSYYLTEATEMLSIPIWPFRACVTIGCIALSLRLTLQCVGNLLRVVKR